MAGRLIRNGRVILPLHERGEKRNILALRREAAGIMPGAPAEIIGDDVDAAFADRRRAQQVDGQAPEMGEARRGRGAFDRATDERRRRAGVLVVGVPWPAGEGACAKHALVEFDVGGVQGRASYAVAVSHSRRASRMSIEAVFTAIGRTGLVPRGAFLVSDEERQGALADVRTIALIGMAGRTGWEAFAASPDAHDGEADPLNRFSRRVISALADELGATALYPFGGPPYLPFQQWARRAEPVYSSPIGVLIHPTHGLWHSYRGALGFAHALDIPPRATSLSPCDSCAARPCLNACPVAAFSPTGYDVAACAAHLRSAAGETCMTGGCLARRACPVGREHAHGPAQAAFTMRAFLKAREERELNRVNREAQASA